MKTHYISWWNLENLFDTLNSENRPAWLAKELSGELKGWTNEVLEKKLENLSSVIKQINSNNGPDILGVCEVESEFVIQKLNKLPRGRAIEVLSGIFIFYEKPAVFQTFPLVTPR